MTCERCGFVPLGGSACSEPHYHICIACERDHARGGVKDLRTKDGVLFFAPDTLRHADGRAVHIIETLRRFEMRTGLRMPKFEFTYA